MIERIRFLKYIIIFLAEIEMLFFSGIAFGMNSLFPTLSDLRFFCVSGNFSGPCEDQRQYLGYLLVTTVISYSLGAVPIGICFDTFGNYKTKIIGAIMVFVGCLSFGLSTLVNQYLAFVAAAFLGFLAQTLLTCNIALSSYFPSFQNKIVSIFSGSFDSSNFVMTLITLGYRGGISVFASFLVLAFVGLLLLLVTAALCRVISKRDQDVMKRGQELLSQPEVMPMETFIKGTDQYLEERVNLMFPTLGSVLKSRYYITQVAYLTIIFFRYAFFLAELNLQLGHLFPQNNNLVDNLLLRSSYIFICGVLCSPFPGMAVDVTKTKIKMQLVSCNESHYLSRSLVCFIPSLVFCTTMNICLSILILIPHPITMYSAFVTFMLMRVTLFSTHSSYLLHAFPKKFFGKLFGISVLISGAFSFIQYALLFEQTKKLDAVNYSLVVLVTITFLHPILMFLKR